MEKKFEGFPDEKQTWDFPNIINGWVHKLTGAEFKCLWYVLRHTYGWQKTSDKISTSQFMRGIKKRNGEWLDRGTGLSKPKVIESLRKLEEYGFVFSHKEKGKTTRWEVVFKSKNSSCQVVKKLYHTGKETLPVGGKETLPTIPILTIPIRQTASSPEDGANAAHKHLIDFFFQEVELEKGFKPTMDSADGRVLKNALKLYSREIIEDMISFYLQSEKSERAGITLKAIFSTHSQNIYNQKVAKIKND